MTTGQKRIRSGRGHRIIDFAWLIIPTITLIAVAAYIVGAIVLRANPPALAIQSQSMSPTIPQGDLSIIQSTNIAGLRTGNIIAIKLTTPEQSTYHLPGEIVRRIVKIERVNGSEIFVTKGDGNPTNDPFTVAKYAIAGKVIASVPDLGFPILFFSSKQGIIFLISTAIILLIYYILGFLEDRRHYAHATAATMQNVMEMVGYVHDAVQQNQSKALEQIAFTKEQLNTFAERQLSAPNNQSESSTKEESSTGPNTEDEGKVPITPRVITDVTEELNRLLQRSMELRKAAEWASEGDLGPEHLHRLFINAAETIELLLIKFDDPELWPPNHGKTSSSPSFNQAEKMHSVPTTQTTNDSRSANLTLEDIKGTPSSISARGNVEIKPIGTSEIQDVPSNTLMNSKFLDASTQSENSNASTTPTKNSLAREGFLADNDHDYSENDEITLSKGYSDDRLTFYSPKDDHLLNEDEETEIFANQYSIFDSNDEILFDKSAIRETHDEPSKLRLPANKRHHRRSIRRRD